MKKSTCLFTLLCLCMTVPSTLMAKTTYYVDDDSTDTSPRGTKLKPFASISQAIAKAKPGDTVLVREGVYRERVIPVRSGEKGKPITIMGESGKKVVIKGSELWQPEWKSQGKGVYSAVPDAAMFDDVKSDYLDSHNPFEVLLSSTPYERQGMQEVERGWKGDKNLVYTCGQVFVNGKSYKEVPFLNEVSEEGTWYYQPEEKAIYINFGDAEPSKQEVEISTRRRIFAPSERGLGYITVQGFVMEHCGNQYPTNFWMEPKWGQRGAMGLEAGHDWIVRRNVIRHVKTCALDCGYVDQRTPKGMVATNNLIEENYIIDNGAAGIVSCNSSHMVIRGNVVMRNNTMRFWGQKRWEHAGIKCHKPEQGLIVENYVADNYVTDGIWLDNHFPEARVARNVIVNNDKRGIFIEMSDYQFDRLLVDNNVVVGNKEFALYCHDSSGSTFINNLLANTPPSSRAGHGLKVGQVSARTKSYNNTVYNNLFLNNTPVLEFCYPSHRGGEQRIDYNVYSTTEEAADFYLSSACEIPRPWSAEEFYEKIKKEVSPAGALLKPCNKNNIVELSFAQWKQFWKSHGWKNDVHSTLNNSSSVSYDEATQELSVQVDFDIAACGSKKHPLLDVDFEGTTIKQNGKALPGPFQSMKRGKNTFKVWGGLPLIKAGELPDFKTFNK